MDRAVVPRIVDHAVDKRTGCSGDDLAVGFGRRRVNRRVPERIVVVIDDSRTIIQRVCRCAVEEQIILDRISCGKRVVRAKKVATVDAGVVINLRIHGTQGEYAIARLVVNNNSTVDFPAIHRDSVTPRVYALRAG